MLLPWFYRSEDWSSLWCEVEHMVGVKQLCVLGCVLMLPCFKIWQVISPPALRFSVTLWNLPLPWTTPAPKHPSPIIFAEHQLFYVLIIYSSIPPRKFVQLPLGPWITDFTIPLPFSPFLCPPPPPHHTPQSPSHRLSTFLLLTSFLCSSSKASALQVTTWAIEWI